MTKWRDSKGSAVARTRHPLSVNDNRIVGDWPVVGEIHVIAPDYVRLRGERIVTVPQPKPWYPIAGIVTALAVLAVIYG